MVPTDAAHVLARKAFAHLKDRQASLVTTSYALVETYALLGRRVGLDAVGAFRADFEPLLDVVWIDGELHEDGLDLLMKERTRDLSLVDAVSFIVMRRQQIDEAFAYDRHFSRRGIRIVE